MKLVSLFIRDVQMSPSGYQNPDGHKALMAAAASAEPYAYRHAVLN